jgi:biofilm PGA synthesis N-glycosyltransferase PgaC
MSEFHSIKRSLPVYLVRSLLFFVTLYGVFITLSVPWTLKAVVFDEFRYTHWGTASYFWGGILVTFGTLVMLRWCATQCLAFREYDNRILNATPIEQHHRPLVSILVPAYNESDTIVPAIQSLIQLDYPQYEIIVIDDGSTDDTHAKALPLVGNYEGCCVRVITKPNGGKWSALNLAFNLSNAEYVLCVDADSRLSSDALGLLMPRLSEPGVAGVAGQVTVRNRDRLLTRLQAAEYLLGNGGMRMALSYLGLVTVVPGPIGLYKRSVLEEVRLLPCNQREAASHGVDEGKVAGPLSGETFAEDFQLSLSCLALGYRVVYEPRAIAHTKSPHTVEGLISQRYRWMRGTWQVLRIYMRDLRSLTPLRRGVRLPHIMVLLYTADVYVIPTLNFFFWLALGVSAALGMSLVGIGLWVAAVTLLNIMTATVYVLLQDDDPRILAMIPLLDAYQALLVNVAWVIAAIDEMRGARMKWS